MRKGLDTAERYRSKSMAYASGAAPRSKRREKTKVAASRPKKLRIKANYPTAEPWIVELAKKLRKERRTPGEMAMRILMVEAKIDFAEQIPAGRSILDFYVPSARLAVEVDGEYHNYRRANDAKRDHRLRGMGLTVMRFTNDQVTKQGFEVRNALLKAVFGAHAVLAM